MATLIRRVPWTVQPQTPVGIDWGNPVARGLVFCAVPFGNTAIDLVTGVVGTSNNAAISQSVHSVGTGLSRRGEGRAITGTTTTTDVITWPVSTKRGGTMIAEATILCLGGGNSSNNGLYQFAGNCDGSSSGDGFSLGIDNYSIQPNRGAITNGRYGNQKSGVFYSATGVLGDPPCLRTHFFGYSATANGVSGNYFAGGNATAYSGQNANGTTTTNRQATILAPSITGVAGTRNSYVLLALFWDRAISPAEYARIYDNPWQLFTPQSRIIYTADAVAGGIPTLSAAGMSSIGATYATPYATLTF